MNLTILSVKMNNLHQLQLYSYRSVQFLHNFIGQRYYVIVITVQCKQLH